MTAIGEEEIGVIAKDAFDTSGYQRRVRNKFVRRLAGSKKYKDQHDRLWWIFGERWSVDIIVNASYASADNLPKLKITIENLSPGMQDDGPTSLGTTLPSPSKKFERSYWDEFSTKLKRGIVRSGEERFSCEYNLPVDEKMISFEKLAVWIQDAMTRIDKACYRSKRLT